MTEHRPMRAERGAPGWTIRCSVGDYITTPPQPTAISAELVFEDNHGDFAGYVQADTMTGARR